MTVTIETSDFQETEQLLLLLKTLDIKNIRLRSSLQEIRPTITLGDKTIDPQALFGIWKNKPRTPENIRLTAWKRSKDN